MTFWPLLFDLAESCQFCLSISTSGSILSLFKNCRVPCHSSISMAIIKSNLSLFKNCRVPCHPSILMVIIKSNLSFSKPCLIPAYLWLCEMFHSYLHLRSSLKKWWRSPTTAKQNNLSEKSNSTPSSTYSLHQATVDSGPTVALGWNFLFTRRQAMHLRQIPYCNEMRISWLGGWIYYEIKLCTKVSDALSVYWMKYLMKMGIPARTPLSPASCAVVTKTSIWNFSKTRYSKNASTPTLSKLIINQLIN